jgi:hypothetical protein
LQSCCLPSKRRWSGKELFEKLDTFVASPVFMPLYRTYANDDGFPDLAALLSDLGVSMNEDGSVTLDDSTSLAAVRKAMFQKTIPSGQ